MTTHIAEGWLLAPLPTTTRKENDPPPFLSIQTNAKKEKKNSKVRGRRRQAPVATEAVDPLLPDTSAQPQQLKHHSSNQKPIEDPASLTRETITTTSGPCLRMPDPYAMQVIRNRYGSNCDLYAIFNVKKSANVAQIRSAYFRLGRQTMLQNSKSSNSSSLPNQQPNQSPQKAFHAITKAFEILAHADTRAYYDTYGLEQKRSQQETFDTNDHSTCMNVHSHTQPAPAPPPPQTSTEEEEEDDDHEEAATTISGITYNTTGNASSIGAAASTTSSILKRSKSWGPSSRSHHSSNKNNHPERDSTNNSGNGHTPQQRRQRSSSSKPRKICWNEHVEELVYPILNTSIDTSYTTSSSSAESTSSFSTSPSDTPRNSSTGSIHTSNTPDRSDSQGNVDTSDALSSSLKQRDPKHQWNRVPDSAALPPVVKEMGTWDEEMTILEELEKEQNGTDILDGLEASLEQLGNSILHGFSTSSTNTTTTNNKNETIHAPATVSSSVVPIASSDFRIDGTDHTSSNHNDNDSEHDDTPLVVFTERIVLPSTNDHSCHPPVEARRDPRNRQTQSYTKTQRQRPTVQKSSNAMEDNDPHAKPAMSISTTHFDPFSATASFVHHLERSKGNTTMAPPNTATTSKSAIPAFDPFSTDESSQDAETSFVSITWTEDPIPTESQWDETPTKPETPEKMKQSDHCSPVRQTMSFDDAFSKKRQSSIITVDTSSTVDQKRPVDTVIAKETLNASGITFLTHNTPEKTQPLSVEIEKAWNEFAKQAQETITVAQQSVENSVRALSPVFGAPSSESSTQYAAVVTPSHKEEDANARKRARNAVGAINNTQGSTTTSSSSTFLDSLNSYAQCIMDNMNLLGLQFNSTMEIANKEITSKWKEANQGISSTIGEANKAVRNTLVLPEDEMDGMLEVLGIEMNLSLDAMDTSHDSLQKSFTF
jgi:curved DNA-binding protein CbpA